MSGERRTDSVSDSAPDVAGLGIYMRQMMQKKKTSDV
jgi:hypothetical protein